MSNHIANKIEAKDKNLGKILNDERFKIDVFQRDYRWQRKHIEELISDLSISFLSNYKEGDKLDKYDNYDSYYLGPIVICEDTGSLSIVDGQQRLTSLTILLIYLQNLQKELGLFEAEIKDLNKYLYVNKAGRTSLILDIPEREDVFELLIRGDRHLYVEDNDNESVKNIIQRFEDIQKLFPDELKRKEVLPIFIEWLLFKVVLVEIKAFSMKNAYTIFETMNDRGLNLNPTEMLKGFLLSKVSNNEKSFDLNDLWKEKIGLLKREVGNESDLEFIRAWLRGKYADTIRQTKQGATNEDFELIGSQFHSWVRNNGEEKIGLLTEDDYFFFIQSDFDFYSDLFLKLYKFKNDAYSEDVKNDSFYVPNFYSIADSLSLPLYISPISKVDSKEEVDSKLEAVANFLDKYVNLRLLQGRSITQSTIRYYFYDLIKTIRHKSVEELSSIFQIELSKLQHEILERASLKSIYMDNSGYYHYFYARIMYHLKTESIDFRDLMRSRRQNSFILVRIFNMDDVIKLEGEEGTDVYDFYINSVVGYCLIRRYEWTQFYTINEPIGKLKFLFEMEYLPELKGVDLNEIKSLVDFFDLRGLYLMNNIEEIWMV